MTLLRVFPYSFGFFFLICPLIATRRELWPCSFKELLTAA